MMIDVPVIAITGGPCAGKSTFLAQAQVMLNERGIRAIVISEAATELITAGITPMILGGREFQLRLLNFLLQREDWYLDLARSISVMGPVVVLCDRGALDAAAYVNEAEFDEVLAAAGTTYGKLRTRYRMVIHLVTAADGAEEFYTVANNAARKETPEQARALDGRTQQAWLAHPHHFIVKNGTDFSKKMAHAVQAMERVIDMPQARETELKYRVHGFTPALLPPEAVATDIVQTYLICEGPGERRVRSSTTRGETVFTYTEKRPTGERGTRDEREEMIDEARYRQLLTEQDPATVPIEKTRHCFTYAGHRYELDVYSAGRLRDEGLVVLEIELRDIHEQVKFPAGWNLEDVTDNGSFKNRSLAQKVS